MLKIIICVHVAHRCNLFTDYLLIDCDIAFLNTCYKCMKLLISNVSSMQTSATLFVYNMSSS